MQLRPPVYGRHTDFSEPKQKPQQVLGERVSLPGSAAAKKAQQAVACCKPVRVSCRVQRQWQEVAAERRSGTECCHICRW